MGADGKWARPLECLCNLNEGTMRQGRKRAMATGSRLTRHTHTHTHTLGLMERDVYSLLGGFVVMIF